MGGRHRLLSAAWPAIRLGLCRGGNFHREDEFVEIDSMSLGWSFLVKLTSALLLQ